MSAAGLRFRKCHTVGGINLTPKIKRGLSDGFSLPPARASEVFFPDVVKLLERLNFLFILATRFEQEPTSLPRLGSSCIRNEGVDELMLH